MPSWSNDKWGIVSYQDDQGNVKYYRTGTSGSKERTADLSVTITGNSTWYTNQQTYTGFSKLTKFITATFTGTSYFTMKGGGQAVNRGATGN